MGRNSSRWLRFGLGLLLSAGVAWAHGPSPRAGAAAAVDAVDGTGAARIAMVRRPLRTGEGRGGFSPR
jgi:hypothetical protein